jgi:hypothetical protein
MRPCRHQVTEVPVGRLGSRLLSYRTTWGTRAAYPLLISALTSRGFDAGPSAPGFLLSFCG